MYYFKKEQQQFVLIYKHKCDSWSRSKKVLAGCSSLPSVNILFILNSPVCFYQMSWLMMDRINRDRKKKLSWNLNCFISLCTASHVETLSQLLSYYIFTGDFDSWATHYQCPRRTYIYLHRLRKDVQTSTAAIPPSSAHFLPSPQPRLPLGHQHQGESNQTSSGSTFSVIINSLCTLFWL